ncbi:hypothetical protein HID58_072839 [Brassica napus]|uniref:Macro domain-containing protein n=2 Tax=Brassica napus TaxID=3708 RepID=A0ABQ7Z5J1_BRANA|nr:hypothetical protein HID58_072839 [Brassica napus]
MMYQAVPTATTSRGGIPTESGDYVVTLDQVPRWSDVEQRSSSLEGGEAGDPSHSNPRYANPLASSSSEAGSSGNGMVSKFPVDHEINSRIYLWRGEPWNLEVDAVVNSTNENLDEAHSSPGLHAAAGPGLAEQCATLGGCRTGMAKVTNAYDLPARRVIHTVGPKYAVKYHTAAENALSHCYRSCLELLIDNGLQSIATDCIYTEAKNYPREPAAHVSIRTVRRFLEKHKDKISAVVFCTTTSSDTEIYKRLLPLYFPRDEHEEEVAISKLPADVGDENGETVIDERKIRIQALPNKPLDRSFPALVQRSSTDLALVRRNSNHLDSYLDPTFMSLIKDPDERRQEQWEKTAQAQSGFNFVKLLGFGDLGGPPLSAAEEYSLHSRYLAKANSLNLSEIAEMKIVYRGGVDTEGHPVMVVVGAHFLLRCLDLERFVLYVVKEFEPLIQKPYSIVYFHSAASLQVQPDLGWMKRLQQILGRKHQRNLQAIYVLHPTLQLKATILAMQMFVNNVVWKKVVYADRLLQLFKYVPREQLTIPDFVFQLSMILKSTEEKFSFLFASVNVKMTQYMPLFRSCSSLRTLSQLHAHLLVTGRLRHDPLPVTKLIESYTRMGSPHSSRLVFESFPYPDSFMYGVLIKCNVWCHLFDAAIDLYHRLVFEKTQISKFVFPSVLRACAGSRERLGIGEKVHGRIVKSGLDEDNVIETSLLCMYGQTGNLSDAEKVFDGMSVRDIVAWSTLVSSCLENGEVVEALRVFKCMVDDDGVEPDAVTMISVVEGCGELGCLRTAKSVHGMITRKMFDFDETLCNSLLSMYSKCGDLLSAERIFELIVNKSAVSWTAVISSYNRGGFYEKALRSFSKMLKYGVEPSLVTLYSVLSSCGLLKLVREGKSVHGFAVRRELEPNYESLSPALVELYAECGKLTDSEAVLHVVGDRNIVSWNSLISLYANKGMEIEALSLFRQMVTRRMRPDSFTLASSISSCVSDGLVRLGKQIHGHVVRTDVSDEFVQNSMIDMYSKNGLTDSACAVFGQIKDKGVVTWNSMLCGFSQNGNSLETINLFDYMYRNCLEINEVTFLAVIQVCSSIGSLEKGRWVHHKLILCGLKDLFTETALIDMYAKCGDLNAAETVFKAMSNKSIVSWSSMINAYGMHGRIGSAVSTFNQMVESGTKPNEVVFMNVLSACGHSGSVREGKLYFNLMKSFGISPNSEHFACFIDLLSRSGDLKEAYRTIKEMPFLADASVWGSLVNGCRIHQRMDIIKAIKKDLSEIVTDDTGYYTLLSNIYAEEGEWEEFRRMRSAMKSLRLKKVPGYSSIEIDQRVYRFGAGEEPCFGTEEIYRCLRNLQNVTLEAEYLQTNE